MQVDRGAAALVVAHAVGREVALVTAPAELARLQRFVDEGVDRPGVDELARLAPRQCVLRVAFGDMDDANPESLGEQRPAFAIGRRARVATVAGDVEERLLDEVRREPGIGAVREQRRRRASARLAQRERSLAERVVGSRCRGEARVGVLPMPWLDRGVEIERAALATENDQVDAAHAHGQVEEEVAGLQFRREQGTVVVARQPRCDRRDARRVRCGDADRIGRHDENLLSLGDVTQQQRQRALPRAAEADHDDAAAKADVVRVALDVHVALRRATCVPSQARTQDRSAATNRVARHRRLGPEPRQQRRLRGAPAPARRE